MTKRDETVNPMAQAVSRIRDVPKPVLREHLSDVLARRLEELNLSQSDAARRIGTSRDNVHGWVNGNTFPRLQMLEKIAQGLSMSVMDLLPSGALDGKAITTTRAPVFELIMRPGGKCRIRLDIELPLEAGMQIAEIVRKHDHAD